MLNFPVEDGYSSCPGYLVVIYHTVSIRASTADVLSSLSD
jgi:hypothetical protein